MELFLIKMTLSAGNDLVPSVLKLQTTQSKLIRLIFSSVQSLSHVPLFQTPWSATCQASLSVANSWSLLKVMSIESVMPSNHVIVPFSSCLQSFPASGSLQMSQFFTSGGQSIDISASASVLLVNIQEWFPLGLTGWISLLARDSWSLLQHHSSKASVIEYIDSVKFPTLKVFIALLCKWKWVKKVKSLSHVQLFVTPWTLAYQAPLSTWFSRQ